MEIRTENRCCSTAYFARSRILLRWGLVFCAKRRKLYVIIFDIDNLKKDGKYQLGLTWWDHDDIGRKQSVWGLVANVKGQRIILDSTPLPAYKNKKQMPGQHILDLPADLISKGNFSISIQNDSGPNAVLSEIWLQKVQ